MVTIELPTREEIELERKEQEKIYKLEKDLIDAGVIDTIILGQIWERCHECAWNPIADYNSIIIDKHNLHFKKS